MKISIRTKATKKGLSIYLDYNTPKDRYEFLGIYLFDEKQVGRKLTQQEKDYNKEVRMKVDTIMLKRVEDYTNGIFRKHGIEFRKKQNQNFLEYFDKIMEERRETSDNNYGNWLSARNHLAAFIGEREIDFSEVDEDFIKQFKNYLLYKTETEGPRGRKLAINSALSYFIKIRIVIKRAVDDKYFYENPLKRVKCIAPEETKREILTTDELRRLYDTPCQDKNLKKAFLFSCLTGMRFSDLEKLMWSEIQHSADIGYFMRFKQKKTAGQVLIYISDEAFRLLGSPIEGHERVFPYMYYSAWKNQQLREWVCNADIKRKITFHSARHTFATLQLNAGTDITVVSNLLGHKDIKTTQIYAKITNQSKRDAVNRISIF